jgi:DNA-binding response OmpR family regulator
LSSTFSFFLENLSSFTYFIQMRPFKKGMFPMASNRSSKKRILIVDDDPHIQGLLVKMLTAHEYATEVASDGFEAGIKIMKFRPGLVILDLFMPGMDGFQVCKQMKENPDTSHVKILILTGYDTKENRDRTIQAGADGYLAKPAEKDTLIRHVEDLLGLREKSGGLHRDQAL